MSRMPTVSQCKCWILWSIKGISSFLSTFCRSLILPMWAELRDSLNAQFLFWFLLVIQNTKLKTKSTININKSKLFVANDYELSKKRPNHIEIAITESNWVPNVCKLTDYIAIYWRKFMRTYLNKHNNNNKNS